MSLNTSEMFANENTVNKQRPNYFVAVQVSDPEILARVRKIQHHIVNKNKDLDDCMISIPTLHITLMVMNISDSEMHERALKALQNVYEEQNDIMCENPLILNFCGLGNFGNRVLYAKMKKNDSFKRLHCLAESVRKQFADLQIFSTDTRNFNPHLTIAKINFSRQKQKGFNKIEPSCYKQFLNYKIGDQRILGIQLLKMAGPKSSAGYYMGSTLNFDSKILSDLKPIVTHVSEKKREIRTKISNILDAKINKNISTKNKRTSIVI
ncbi:hypothetical protein CDAR_303341 [Caerostris darwini]|uniref:A-kinase anchor protein 7-like phosphoesterase domain-containing protein n=1 Tax=Caerostris darwini TaxID=1538125 RepID=A0AAV4MZ57_9ARAC|nr:hypothetical protein CDAR_303341 [Caerostris darwini]